jgi:hypothetical protein
MDSPRITSRPRRTTSTGSGSPPSVWTTMPPGSPTWPGSLTTLGNQPTICSRTTRSPRPEESDRRRRRLRRADARRHAGPAGSRSCRCRCASVLPSFCGALRYLMDNRQLQHSRSLAFDEQRHRASSRHASRLRDSGGRPARPRPRGRPPRSVIRRLAR